MAEKREKPEEKKAGPAEEGKAKDENLIAALCYLPVGWFGIFVSLFILLTENKENKFLKFHATQAIIFFVVSMFFLLVLGIFGWITAIVVAVFTYGIGAFCVGLLVFLIAIVWICFMFFAAWKAFNGEEYEIPFIGKVAREHV